MPRRGGCCGQQSWRTRGAFKSCPPLGRGVSAPRHTAGDVAPSPCHQPSSSTAWPGSLGRAVGAASACGFIFQQMCRPSQTPHLTMSSTWIVACCAGPRARIDPAPQRNRRLGLRSARRTTPQPRGPAAPARRLTGTLARVPPVPGKGLLPVACTHASCVRCAAARAQAGRLDARGILTGRAGCAPRAAHPTPVRSCAGCCLATLVPACTDKSGGGAASGRVAPLAPQRRAPGGARAWPLARPLGALAVPLRPQCARLLVWERLCRETTNGAPCPPSDTRAPGAQRIRRARRQSALPLAAAACGPALGALCARRSLGVAIARALHAEGRAAAQRRCHRAQPVWQGGWRPRAAS